MQKGEFVQAWGICPLGWYVWSYVQR